MRFVFFFLTREMRFCFTWAAQCRGHTAGGLGCGHRQGGTWSSSENSDMLNILTNSFSHTEILHYKGIHFCYNGSHLFRETLLTVVNMIS